MSPQTQTSPFQSLLVWEVGKAKSSIWGVPTHYVGQSWLVSFYRAPGSSMGRAPLPYKNPKSFLSKSLNSHQNPWVNNPWCLEKVWWSLPKAATYKFIPKPTVLL